MKIQGLIFTILAVFLSNFSFSQEFDTLYKFSDLKGNSDIRVYDFQVLTDNQFLILFERNKELFVYDSRKAGEDFKLNARTVSKNGDKYVDSKSYQVKNPKFYDNGNLVIAESDFDHDGLGGRFIRWDIVKRIQLEPIITGQWGIGITAINPKGNMFVNYYFEKPGNKIPVINTSEGKSKSIKRKQILYADKIYFTDNSEYIVFNSVLRNRQFVNIAFDAKTLDEVDISSIPLYHKEKSGQFAETSNLKYSITLINEGILISNKLNGSEKILKGVRPNYIALNSQETKLYLIVKSSNQVFLLQYNSLQNIFDEL